MSRHTYVELSSVTSFLVRGPAVASLLDQAVHGRYATPWSWPGGQRLRGYLDPSLIYVIKDSRLVRSNGIAGLSSHNRGVCLLLSGTHDATFQSHPSPFPGLDAGGCATFTQFDSGTLQEFEKASLIPFQEYWFNLSAEARGAFT